MYQITINNQVQKMMEYVKGTTEDTMMSKTLKTNKLDPKK